MVTWYMDPLGWFQDGWEKKLTSRGWVTLSTRFLRVSFTAVALWDTFTWDTNIFILRAIQRGIATSLAPRSPSPSSSDVFLIPEWQVNMLAAVRESV